MYFEDVEYLPISKVYITRLIHSSFFFKSAIMVSIIYQYVFLSI